MRTGKDTSKKEKHTKTVEQTVNRKETASRVKGFAESIARGGSFELCVLPTFGTLEAVIAGQQKKKERAPDMSFLSTRLSKCYEESNVLDSVRVGPAIMAHSNSEGSSVIVTRDDLPRLMKELLSRLDQVHMLDRPKEKRNEFLYTLQETFIVLTEFVEKTRDKGEDLKQLGGRVRAKVQPDENGISLSLGMSAGRDYPEESTLTKFGFNGVCIEPEKGILPSFFKEELYARDILENQDNSRFFAGEDRVVPSLDRNASDSPDFTFSNLDTNGDLETDYGYDGPELTSDSKVLDVVDLGPSL